MKNHKLVITRETENRTRNVVAIMVALTQMN